MANPQTENGYTKIANELFETILCFKCSPNEKDIIWSVIRFTYGFQKTEAEISITKLSNFLNRDKATISGNIIELIRKRIIIEVEPPSFGRGRILKLNKNYEEWEGYSVVEETPTVEDIPTVEKGSTVEESPTVEKGSTVEESPTVENTSTVEDTPTPTVEETSTPTVEETSTIKESIKENRNKNKQISLPRSNLPKHELQVFIESNFPRVAKLRDQMTFDQCGQIILQNKASPLTSDGLPGIVQDTLEAMENYKPLATKYVSVFKTLKNWIKLRNDRESSKRNKTIGTSASAYDDF